MDFSLSKSFKMMCQFDSRKKKWENYIVITPAWNLWFEFLKATATHCWGLNSYDKLKIATEKSPYRHHIWCRWEQYFFSIYFCGLLMLVENLKYKVKRERESERVREREIKYNFKIWNDSIHYLKIFNKQMCGCCFFSMPHFTEVVLRLSLFFFNLYHILHSTFYIKSKSLKERSIKRIEILFKQITWVWRVFKWSSWREF
jgi:hypothetical protein